MSEPFLAEIRIVGFSFPPRGWAFCDGQILPISQNQALFSLLGTTYGGDGQTNFALPDLRGRAPVHSGAGLFPGAKGGAENHTLNAAEMPQHTHALRALTADATAGQPAGQPAGRMPAHAEDEVYAPDNAGTESMSNLAVVNAGGGQAHNNMQPYLAVHFCIALQGVFPPQ